MTEALVHILVVDDEPAICGVLRALLEDEGYVVRVAMSGAEALSILAHEHPDLVILDLMMPPIDGDEVCRFLRSRPDTALLPIIILSAARDGRERARRAHASAFLPKPFQVDELLSTVETYLAA